MRITVTRSARCPLGACRRFTSRIFRCCSRFILLARDWRKLEQILVKNGSKIAAVCIEPIVQGAGGMLIQPPGFLRRVRGLCNRHNVLLICDEVAVGFGRTGKMFACEHENVSPDLMCVAKGISAGYLPLAATFATQIIYDAFLGEPWEGKTFYHGHTYTGNALACAAAIASLDLFEKNDLVASVAEKSLKLRSMLDELRDLPHVGEIRQKGFMVGIELVQEKETRRPFDPKRRIGAEVCQRIRKRGVILRPLGDVVILMPPLAMGVQQLRTIVDAVREEVGGSLGCSRPHPRPVRHRHRHRCRQDRHCRRDRELVLSARPRPASRCSSRSRQGV